VPPADPLIECRVLGEPAGVAFSCREGEHFVLASRLDDVQLLGRLAGDSIQRAEPAAERIEVSIRKRQGVGRLERLNPGHRRLAGKKVEQRAGNLTFGAEAAGVLDPALGDVELANQPFGNEEAIAGLRASLQQPLLRLE
jgi:hypothetical protein